jgi:hypothetical protein
MPIDGRARVVPGHGVVARTGAALVVVVPESPSHQVLSDRVLELAGSIDGAALVRAVTALVAATSAEDVPPLGLLTGELLLLTPGAEAETRSPAGATRLSGDEATTCVERRVPPDVSWVRVHASTGAGADPHGDLPSGVVRGNGFEVGDLAATPPTATAPETEVSFVAFSLDGGEPDLPDEVDEPAAGSRVERRAARPSWGTLVADDGQVLELDTDLVLGREPAPGAGRGVRPVELDDPQLAMSRVHCRVMLDGEGVLVEDAHSANGTFVALPGQEWSRLMAGVPTTIVPGTRIAVGGRSLTYRASREG